MNVLREHMPVGEGNEVPAKISDIIPNVRALGDLRPSTYENSSPERSEGYNEERSVL